MSAFATPPAPAPEILIAEDSPTQSLLLKTTLERHGFNVITAADGEQALDRLATHHPLLVLSDIQMPTMNGYELCRRIKSDPARQNLPVILLTSLSAPHDIICGLACGADNFVVKPYEEEFLLQQIHSALANRELQDSAQDGAGIPVEFAGDRYYIKSNPRQILSLLLSTYSTALQTNKELIQTHEKLKEAQAELIQAEKFQSIGRLAAGVAHEVRNPLAIMEMGLAYLENTAAHEEGQPVMDEMREALHRADDVIKSLMEISSPREFGMREADLHDTIRRTIDRFLDELEREEIRVEYDFAPDVPPLKMSEERMEQVLANLVTNARQAMPGGGKLTIATRLLILGAKQVAFDAGDRSGVHFRTGERVVSIEVRDTGAGIASENLPKVFDPFFSTRPTGKGSGMGLGLAVARKFVELHSGSISLGNQPAGGAVATILLKLP